MYQLQATCGSTVELYRHLLEIEAEYCHDINVEENFARTVHRLHPVKYMTSEARKQEEPLRSLKSIVTECPYPKCNHVFDHGVAYSMHILFENVQCPQCHGIVNYQVIKMAAIRSKVPALVVPCMLQDFPVTIRVPLPPIPADGKIKTFKNELKDRMRAAAPKGSHFGVKRLRYLVKEEIEKNFNCELGSFELDLVHAMYRQLEFINKICPNLNYWKNPIVLEAALIRYHKFMKLARQPSSKETNDDNEERIALVPTADIDLVWHTHQNHHDEYKRFCMKLLEYRGLVNHDDTIGGGDLMKGYADTFIAWAAEFHEPYSSYAPDFDAWTQEKMKNRINMKSLEKKWTKLARLPSKDCRFAGVNESISLESLPLAYTDMINNFEKNFGVEPVVVASEVYMSVIGTPVMDSRVRLKESRHEYLMKDRRQAYHYYASNGVKHGQGMGGCAVDGCGKAGCASGTSGDDHCTVVLGI